MSRQTSSRIHEQMTDKKLCGLRSVPSLFRVSPIWSACCRPVRRRHYKETALLYGRVAGRLTLSVNARSLRSLGQARSSRSARLPPPFARSARSRQRLCLPWLCSARPPSRRSTSARSSARSARSFLRFTPKIKAVFSRKKSVRGERTFSPKMECLVFLRYRYEKHESKQILYITSL